MANGRWPINIGIARYLVLGVSTPETVALEIPEVTTNIAGLDKTEWLVNKGVAQRPVSDPLNQTTWEWHSTEPDDIELALKIVAKLPPGWLDQLQD